MNQIPSNKKHLACAIAITLGLGLTPAWAANAIQGMGVNTNADGSVDIRFSMSETPTTAPSHFSIDQPARIALDFPDTTVGMGKRVQAVESGAVHDVRFAEAQGRTRAVISLKENSSYDLRVAGQDVILSVRPRAGAGAAGVANPQTEMAQAQPAYGAEPAAEIDFRRGPQGEGRLLVQLPQPNVPMNMNAEAKRLVIDLPQTRLSEGKYDVGDFATPVRQVTVQQRGSGSRLILETSAPFDKLAYQTGNQLTVEVRPLPKEQAATAAYGPKTYKGERLTLKFQDIEIRPLLQLLADFTGNNIVVSDSVQGRMSLRLENVPWDQAMDLILTTKGLSQRKNGNVIFVAPTAEIAAREKAELDAKKQSAEIEPLITQIIKINYAKASDIRNLIHAKFDKTTEVLTGGIQNIKSTQKASGFLSPRGEIVVDDRTNSIIISDISEYLEKTIDLIRKLDVPTKQVLIESRIVIATDDFSKELGARWGVTGIANGNGDPAIFSGTPSGTNTMLNNYISGSSTGIPSLPSDRYNVNIPTTKTPTGGLALAILGSNVLLDLELSAMQAEGNGEVISSPRVLTTNGHKALIKAGDKIPYEDKSSSGATTVSFVEANLATEVTPQITPNNNIILDIKVNKDEADFARQVKGVPLISTKEVNTKLQIRNGETVVLGGIYEINDQNSVTKVPFFGDIPLIGNIFKNNINSKRKIELIIFVTPRIIENGAISDSNT